MFKGRIISVLSVVLCLAFLSVFFFREYAETAALGKYDTRPTVILDAGHGGFDGRRSCVGRYG